LQASWPDREIETDFSLAERVNCDRTRIAQLFSNLLGNAITHGAADRPIRVHAATDGAQFELWVSNAGDPIPAAALDRLFRPFTRGAIRPNQQGLGLGLYIASEIARAHGGTLDVSSTPEETRFTFRMPLR
jgi:sigma-B regulation protein RsbU (phosphoserine phosphatase)